MLTVLETQTYSDWMASLRDIRGQAAILKRIRRIETSEHFGDCKSIGDGVTEMRIDFGPGYRVYFCRRGSEVVILLGGGDKGSQARDIRMAKALAREVENG